jgi:tryptophan 2,3-dioxygenase
MLAVDRTAQEYFLCLQTQLATMTVQQFTAALTHALSFRVWQLNETEILLGETGDDAQRRHPHKQTHREAPPNHLKCSVLIHHAPAVNLCNAVTTRSISSSFSSG